MLLRKIMAAGVLVMSIVVGPIAQAQSSKQMDSASAQSRVFLLTATYGVVAGTLTGLGSLAFYDHPSQHSRNIAMGASIGLYVGILLGVYMTYGISDPKSPGASGGASAPASSKKSSEDPLRLDSSAPRTPAWAPYFALNEKQKSAVVGLHLQF